MSNSLMIYLNKRLREEDCYKRDNSETGPVITISREVGCNASKLSKLIAKQLNENKMSPEWKVLSKEIFYQSAKELDMEPERVKRILKNTDKHTFDEILNAFNDKQFKSERKIVNTVRDVVRSFACDGYSIIIGRAGNVIARDIKKAIHIRLVAPFEYRLYNIMENNRLNREEAIQFIRKIEKERIAYRKAILKEEHLNEIYDITINRAAFSDEETVEIILFAIEKKKLLTVQRQRIDFF